MAHCCCGKYFKTGQPGLSVHQGLHSPMCLGLYHKDPKARLSAAKNKYSLLSVEDQKVFLESSHQWLQVESSKQVILNKLQTMLLHQKILEGREDHTQFEYQEDESDNSDQSLVTFLDQEDDLSDSNDQSFNEQQVYPPGVSLYTPSKAPSKHVNKSDFWSAELLDILHSINAPLNAFERVMKWARDAHNNKFEFVPHSHSHKAMIKRLLDYVGPH